MHWVFQSESAHGNVVINFRCNPIDDFTPFARGYHEAGKRLARILEESNGYRDFEGYPILFLYRHALELYMKAIVYRGAKLLQLLDIGTLEITNILKDHRLSVLLPGMKAIFDGVEWTWKTNTAGMRSYEDFSELVKGIEEIDPRSYCFRYPTNTGGAAPINRHTVINVIGLSKNMDPVLDLLDTAIMGLREEFDVTAEAKWELQSVIKQIGLKSDVGGGE